MLNLKDANYRQLSPTERFKLVIAAFSRGDDDEIARLKRTCPTKHYTMIDCEYTDLIAGLTWVIAQFSEICEYSYHQIILCETCINFVSTIIEATETKMAAIQSIKNQHISNLKSTYQALAEFCRENKIDYDDTIKWVKITPEMSHEYDNYLMTDVECNRTSIEYAKEKFYSIWQRYVPA